MQEFIKEVVLQNIWGALMGAIASIWIWVRSKPKEKVENEGGHLDNAKKSLEISERVAARLEKQLEASDGIILKLKEKLRLELEETNNCKKALKAVKNELDEWKKIASENKIELEKLRKECKLLRLAIEGNEKNTNTDYNHNI